MGIAERYNWLLDNEEGHFAHHQMLQADMIDSFKMHESTITTIGNLLEQNKEMLWMMKLLIERNQLLEQRISAIAAAIQTKKTWNMKIYNLEAEFSYSGKSATAVLTPNIYPILDMLIFQQEWVQSDLKWICLAFIDDDNIVQNFMPVIHRTLQVNLKKKQAWSCKVSFIYIDKEICMHESNEAWLEVSSLPTLDELTKHPSRKNFGEKNSTLMKIETCASS